MMVFSLALRNLLYDRARLLATLAGVTFSVMLMAGQTAIYLGASRTIATIIDRSRADLWILPVGSQSFEEALPLLTEFDRQSALSTPGVKRVTSLVTCFARWQQPSGETDTIVLIGSEPNANGPQPFDAGVLGQDVGLSGVVVDSGYLDALGAAGVGSIASIGDHRIHIGALSKGIRSFTRAPYVFVRPDQARKYLDLPPRALTFLLVDVENSASLEEIRSELSKRIRNVEVLTQAEFRARTLDRWLNQTGAGQALIMGSILGAIIGAAIIAQTMNMSVREHLSEFALLRAMGSSSSYVQTIVLAQVVAIAGAGVIVGLGALLLLVPLSENSPLRLTVSVRQLTLVVVSTLVIGMLSSASALSKVKKVDPASLLR